MIKVETMKRYEAETGRKPKNLFMGSEESLIHFTREYVEWLEAQLTWRKVKEELPKRDERVWCKDLRGSIRDATFTRHNHAWIFVCSAGYVLDLRNVASWLPIIKETTDD